jgi:hypothetical protein
VEFEKLGPKYLSDLVALRVWRRSGVLLDGGTMSPCARDAERRMEHEVAVAPGEDRPDGDQVATALAGRRWHVTQLARDSDAHRAKRDGIVPDADAHRARGDGLALEPDEDPAADDELAADSSADRSNEDGLTTDPDASRAKAVTVAGDSRICLSRASSPSRRPAQTSSVANEPTLSPVQASDGVGPCARR